MKEQAGVVRSFHAERWKKAFKIDEMSFFLLRNHEKQVQFPLIIFFLHHDDFEDERAKSARVNVAVFLRCEEKGF